MKKAVFIAFMLSFASQAHAGDVPQAIYDQLTKVVPGYDPANVSVSPVTGLYEFTADAHILYISADGRYVISGDVIDMETRTNLTKQKQGKVTLAAINKVGDDQMIIFGDDKAARTLTIFTDVDCPYCSMMHKEVPKLNEAGIRIRYLLYPRAGMASPTYAKSVSVWCADDQKKALGIAKSGGKIESKTCDNPVQDHMKLGEMVGVSGTPTLILDDGRILPGYVPADKLIAIINQKG
jgi:thiol:disulfide interchange protein DsbC